MTHFSRRAVSPAQLAAAYAQLDEVVRSWRNVVEIVTGAVLVDLDGGYCGHMIAAARARPVSKHDGAGNLTLETDLAWVEVPILDIYQHDVVDVVVASLHALGEMHAAGKGTLH